MTHFFFSKTIRIQGVNMNARETEAGRSRAVILVRLAGRWSSSRSYRFHVGPNSYYRRDEDEKNERIVHHCRVVGHQFCGPCLGGGLSREGPLRHHLLGRRRGNGQRFPGHRALRREGARQADRPAEQAGRHGRRRPHAGLQSARGRLQPVVRGGEPPSLQGPGHRTDRL